MHKIKPLLGQRIIEACEDANIPAWGRNRILGKQLSVSPSAVSKWFSDQSLPTIGNIVDLAEFLNVRTEWLITGKGKKAKDYDTTKEFSEATELLQTLTPDQQSLVLDFIKMIKSRNK